MPPGKRNLVDTSTLTPSDWRRARLHFAVMDHGLLRTFWTNLHQIAPGVWRSNQPSPRRLARYRDMGIRTVISLRGPSNNSWSLLEREACRALGLTLTHLPMVARSLPPRQRLLDLIEVFREAEHPVLIHCKSGSDRTGLASAIYLNVIRGVPIETARKQLGLRYLHLKQGRAGDLGQLLERYARRNAAAPIALEEWIAAEYDPEELAREIASAGPGARA